jgi:hypothetical protein
VSGTFALGIAVGLMIAIAVYLVASLFISIREEKRRARITHTWRNFSLSLIFCIMFFVSWGGHAIAQWQLYTDEQREHGQPTEMGDFLANFSQATLENWQSEFLQLFSFVVLAALFIHHGSAESKDGEERIEQSVKRIEKHLGIK